jgi:hypothetical protein
MANGKIFWTDKCCPDPDPDPKLFILDPTPDPDPQHCLDVSVCLLYSSLYVPGGVLHLDVSVHQQPVLCQEVYGLQQLLLLLNCLSTRAWATPGRVLSTKAFVCILGVCLLEPVLNLCVSVYRRFCVHLGCLSTRACVALMCVRLQEILCAPVVSFYKSLCCTHVCVRLQELLCAPWVSSTRVCAAPIFVLFVLFLGMSVYKSLCFTCMWMSTRTLCGTWSCMVPYAYNFLAH